MRKVIILLTVLVIASSLMAAEVSFKATVNKLNCAFEDRIQLELTASVTDPSISTSPIMPSSLEGLTIGGSGSSVERSGDTIVRQYTYELIPRRGGEITIPAFRLEYRDSLTIDTLHSEAIIVTVAAPLPVDIDNGGESIWFYLIIIAIIAAGAAWLIRRSNRAKLPPESDWREPYRKKAAETLLLAERQNYLEFSAEMTKLIVALLERKHDNKLSGQTTDGLVAFLEDKGVDESTVQLFRDFLRFAETSKYSSSTIDTEQGSKAAKRAERIVELLLE